jgi:hypothetical protein
MRYPDTSSLNALPTEICYQVMEELLVLHKTNGMITRLPRTKRPLRYGFKPDMQPQVLRINKKMHNIGRKALERSNRWIILDMDCAYLLTYWASVFLEIIVVDPESAQNLPSGMMYIRVKPFSRASGHAPFWRCFWPKAMRERQIVLVAASHLGNLVSALRMVELAHVLRIMPGEIYRNRVTDMEYRVNRGEHGLSIRIHINQNYPESCIRTSLEHFRILHGPLNEISIIGAPDEHQARSIEASIRIPRDVASESTFSEMLMHVVDLIALADVKSQEGLSACVSMLYEQARAMVVNTHNNDDTPWGGWITEATAQDSHFEMLILCASVTNFMVNHMLNRGNWICATADRAIARHMTHDSEGFLEETGLEPQLRAYIYLFNGLHCVLSSKVGQSRFPNMAVVIHGLDLIIESRTYITQMSRSETVLFRAAYKMRDMVLGLGPSVRFKITIKSIIDAFAIWFSKHLKPVKWRVHESLIPQALQIRGVLQKMKNASLLTHEELDRYLIVDTLEIEAGAEGDSYLL